MSASDIINAINAIWAAIDALRGETIPEVQPLPAIPRGFNQVVLTLLSTDRELELLYLTVQTIEKDELRRELIRQAFLHTRISMLSKTLKKRPDRRCKVLCGDKTRRMRI
jgi:hypothetical protein